MKEIRSKTKWGIYYLGLGSAFLGFAVTAPVIWIALIYVMIAIMEYIFAYQELIAIFEKLNK